MISTGSILLALSAGNKPAIVVVIKANEKPIT
jgi:hypothetical protein